MAKNRNSLKASVPRGNKPLYIAGERVKLGESKQIKLAFSESYLGTPVAVPVYVLRAKRSGPRVFLTATIHGDELNGLGILRQLLYDTPPALSRGTLIVVPVVNVYGMENHERYMPDRRDLNRSFPGISSGSISSRLAYVLFKEVISKCDYGIDFHTAALRRTNFPNVRADMTDQKTRRLAEAFGCELIVHGKGSPGTLRRTATNAGIPTIILEAGETWKIEPGAVEIGIRGIENVLRWLKMMRGAPIQPPFQVLARQTNWVRAEAGGILAFHSKPGDLVRKGQVLAVNSNVFWQEQRTMISPTDGIILGMATMPAVKPGEPVYHIAKLSKREFNRIDAEIGSIASHQLFSRMQKELATNIIVQREA